jgi:hypothetical protein
MQTISTSSILEAVQSLGAASDELIWIKSLLLENNDDCLDEFSDESTDLIPLDVCPLLDAVFSNSIPSTIPFQVTA